ncbi:unnamed protein product [Heterobilharzia americana]|nr:unnamed protein product [Heterobilharzia americana]
MTIIQWQKAAFQEVSLTLSSMSHLSNNTSQKRAFRQSSVNESAEVILEYKNEVKRLKFASVHDDSPSSPVSSNAVEVLSPIEVNRSSRSNHASSDSTVPGINFIDCAELASLLTSKYTCTLCVPLILDIRSLAAQANLRIQTAIGIPCESRVKLRRALPMLNNFLRERKQCYNTHNVKSYQLHNHSIIICTDSGINEYPLLKDLLHCLVKHLADVHGLDARVLKGGFQEFCNSYGHLCEHPLQKSQKVDNEQSGLSENVQYADAKSSKEGELNFSPNISTENSKCTKQELKYSQLLLPGLGIPVNHRPPVKENATQSNVIKLSGRLDPMTGSNDKNQTANPSSDKWGLSRFCLADSDPCDPKDIFRAQASQIFPFLYLGNESDSQNEAILSKYGIDSILNVTMNTPFLDEERFKCRRLPATDSHSQDLRPYFNTAFQFIEEVRCSGKCVLVHCQAGVSRSPALIIAYVMAYSSLSLFEAYQFIKSRRSVIAPNFAFMGQLFEFESDLASGRFLKQSNILDPILKAV